MLRALLAGSTFRALLAGSMFRALLVGSMFRAPLAGSIVRADIDASTLRAVLCGCANCGEYGVTGIGGVVTAFAGAPVFGAV